MVNFNAKLLIKILIILKSLYIRAILSELEYTDDVPFVHYEVVSLPLNQPIDYSSQNFQQTPKIVAGIQKYENHSNNDIDFNIEPYNVSTTSCELKTNNNGNLDTLSAYILAIDQSQFPFIEVIHIEKMNIFPSSANFDHKEIRNFSQSIQSIKGTKQVIVILRGWRSELNHSQDIKITLSINSEKINDTQYKIIISSDVDSQRIINVYYTIIEYVQDPPSLYSIHSQYHSQYKSMSKGSCFNDPQCTNRIFEAEFFIPALSNVSTFINNYQKCFIALNQIDNDTVGISSDPFYELTIPSYHTTGKIMYYYNLQSQSGQPRSLGTTSTAIFFYKKQCNQSDEKVFEDTCITDCIRADTQEPSLCLNCQSGEYFLIDQQICQSSQPSIGYYCYLGQYNLFICLPCQSQCERCEINSTNKQTMCIQCLPNYYLYNQVCISPKPVNTYCDSNRVCKSCQNSQCYDCTDPVSIPNLCITCYQPLYQLNGICHSKQPDETYCNNFICQQCNDKMCQTCTDPANPPSICDSCKIGDYLYNGKCYTQNSLPENTFCDFVDYTCYKCKDSNCKTCSDPKQSISKCLSCYDHFHLKNDKCEKVNNSSFIQNSVFVVMGVSLITASSSQVQMFLTIQKLNLFIIINILFTDDLNTFILSLKGANPLDNLQKINLFSKYAFIESEDQLETQKITIKLDQTSIITNGGGILVLIIITIFLYFSLLITDKSIQNYYNTMRTERTQKILGFYQKLVCFLFYQFNQLIILVSNYAIFLQIVGLMEKDINLQEIKIVLLLILIIYVLIIVLYHYIVLNKIKNVCLNNKNEDKDNSLVLYKNQLFQYLLQKNIESNFFSRNFVILFAIIEFILIPFSIIINHYEYKVQTSLCMVLQLILCLVSVIVRPSHTFLQNLRLIIDQLVWALIFLFTLILGHFSQNQIENNKNNNIVEKLSLVIKILMIIALFINPIIQILEIILSLIKAIKERKKRKELGTDISKNYELQSNSYSNLRIFNFKKKEQLFTEMNTNLDNSKDYQNLYSKFSKQSNKEI